MVTSLAEAFHLASCQGLDANELTEILLAGPMSNDVFRVKAPKLAARDFSTQATISTVLETNALIVQAARLAGANSPLADRCLELYRATANAGNADQDMVAVVQAIEDGV
jgi:3-hydroxyisobutyrate dehydrogenase